MLVGSLGPACVQGGIFLCDSDTACNGPGGTGRCEPSGYCSFADESCPSRARYSPWAGDGLAGACVDLDGGSSSGSTDDSTTSGTGTALDLPPAPDRPPREIVCGDGWVMGDELCDDGNLADADGCNHDCIPSGTPLWTTIEGGDEGLDDRGRALALAEGGDILLTGRVGGDAGDFWLGRFSVQTGARIWPKVVFGSSEAEEGRGVAVLGDDTIVVCGYRGVADHGLDLVTRAFLDAPIGMLTVLWTAPAANSGPNLDDRIEACLVTRDGQVISVGSIRGPDDSDSTVRGYTKDGAPMWALNVGLSAGLDQALAVARAPSGEIYVAGSTAAVGSTKTDAYLARVSAGADAASHAWTVVVGAPATNEVGQALAIDPDGLVIVAGHRAQRPWLAAYDDGGAQIWERMPTATAIAEIHGIAIDTTGALVTAGYTEAAGTEDIQVVKYDAAGDELWSDVVAGSGGGDDRARAVVIAPDGAVVVTGWVHEAIVQHDDIWLRKYAP